MIVYKKQKDDLINRLNRNEDAKSIRIKRMLDLPDLTRKEDSPIYYVIEAIKQANSLSEHMLVEFPEIVTKQENFDLLGTPDNHPSRSESDTFYLDGSHLLRTQTTTMWSYFLRDEEVIDSMKSEGRVLAVSYGKVYRNDEIDREHYPVFHQVDGICICRRSIKEFKVQDLIDILVDIAKTIYGPEVKWQVADDTFPFTHHSIELQIEWKGDWVEVLGAGLVHEDILVNFGINPDEYNGWAFGFGLDRLAMIKMNIPDIRILWSSDERITRQFEDINSKFEAVSKYPPVDRDISFIVDSDLPLNSIYELIRDCGSYMGEDIIEEVKILDTYSNDKRIGKCKISYTFRIRYRSYTRTFTNIEINDIQEKLRQKVAEELNAELR